MSNLSNQNMKTANSKNTFEFKHFVVSHGRSAMKVGTDGVLLGAWTSIRSECRCVWDVGSGSGLVALMLAQRCNAEIFGIEINHDASLDMADNFSGSQWSDKLHAVNADINLCANCLPKPDLIVCNPPYFSNSLKNHDSGRKCARHESTLGCGQIVRLAAQFLTTDGTLTMVCPTDKTEEIDWETTLAGLSVIKRTDIVTTPRKEPKRTLWEISRRKADSDIHTIESLRKEDGRYSDWYIDLTKNYYLHLND